MIFGYRCCDCEEEIGFGHEHTSLNKDKCPKCGGECETDYISGKSPTVSLDPISGDHIGATSKWEKNRAQKMAKEKKNMENHGTYD